jgi:flagellar basal-body rod modification protein FlgD
VKEVTLYNDGIVAKLDSGKTLVIGPGVKISDGKSETET